MPEQLELISFNICPFVQRSVITLLQKNINHKVTYIDLENPPNWFLEISPLGKVPALRVKDTVLFESAVINEYLDKITPPQLQPTEPLLEAKNKAWIEFCSDMIMNHYLLTVAQNKEDFEKYKNKLRDQFILLEKTLESPPFFNGENISLVDTAIAPLFMRLALFERKAPLELFSEKSKVANWSETLLSLPSVKNSVVDNFSELFEAYLRKSTSYYANLLNL